MLCGSESGKSGLGQDLQAPSNTAFELTAIHGERVATQVIGCPINDDYFCNVW